MNQKDWMPVEPVILQGQRVRLEPLSLEHLPLLEEIAFTPALWDWTTSRIETPEALRQYIEAALALCQARSAVCWVTRSLADDRIVGCTRFADINREYRTMELGWTWVHPDYQRTGINVEAKYLQFTHAFEVMGAHRVALKTHHNNLKSQQAMRDMGAKYEGTFRNHMTMPDGSLRHSLWFSVIRDEWPEVKAAMESRMARRMQRI